jgi:glycosyltransferase involved in cell wall biosynthesis
MKSGEISVIIPAFNRADLISETLDSVFRQTMPPYEVIVVDDGSTDGTPDVVESYGSAVRLMRQENQGAGAARNHGVSVASGEYIHFMDSDDLISPNMYAVQVAGLESHSAAMAYGPWLKTCIDGLTLGADPVAIQQRPLPERPGMDRFIMRGWVTVMQPCLLRKSLLEKVGPYRTDLKPSEDSELLYRIGKSRARMVHTPETILLYRVHPAGQVSIADVGRRSLDWVRFLSSIERHIANSHEPLDAMTRFQFGCGKISALASLNGQRGAEDARFLRSTIRSRTFALEWMTRPWRRLQASLRGRRYGGDYGAAFAVGSVTEIQRGEVEKMGFHLAS